jgi:hypothetical protein
MNDQGVVGIGCFAKPEVLSRVLKKMVENYILGNLEGLGAECGEILRQPELRQLLRAIFAGGTGNHEPADFGDQSCLENKNITGFFLALENQELNISVFTRQGHLKKETYTANLYQFTRLRRKRMN